MTWWLTPDAPGHAFPGPAARARLSTLRADCRSVTVRPDHTIDCTWRMGSRDVWRVVDLPPRADSWCVRVGDAP